MAICSKFVSLSFGFVNNICTKTVLWSLNILQRKIKKVPVTHKVNKYSSSLISSKSERGFFKIYLYFHKYKKEQIVVYL